MAPVPAVDPTLAQLQGLWREMEAGATGAPEAFPWQALLQMGDVFYRGAYPRWRPDVDAALACYQWAARAPAGQVAGLAQAKYIEARTEPLHADDVAGEPLDPAWADAACDAAEAALFRTPADAFGRPLLQPPAPAPALALAPARPALRPWWDAPVAPGAHAHDDDDAMVAALLAATAPPDPYRGGPPPGEGDAQNVHDHAVVAFLRERVHRDLPAQPAADQDPALQWTTAPAATLASRLTQRWRAAGVPDATVQAARQVLQALRTDDHYAVSISEVEALRRVLQKVEAVPSAEARNTLIATLADQLASGVEAGYVVCSTGRLARIVGTLDIVNTVVPPAGGGSDPLTMRPLWAVQEELATLAAKVRDDKLQAVGPDGQRAYEAGAPGAAALSADMQATFEAQVQREYVDRLGMNPSILRPLVDTWKQEL